MKFPSPHKDIRREDLIEELAEVTRRSPVDFRGLSTEAIRTLLRMIQNGRLDPAEQKPLRAAQWLR